jgi:hypothetical protein
VPLINRVVVVPFLVGSWYFHYEQSEGQAGLQTIPRISKLMGQTPVYLSRVVGLKYAPEYYWHAVQPDINASAGFLFNLYASLGMTGIFVSLLLLCALDLLIPLIGALSRPVLPAFLTVLSLICMNLIQTEFGYALFSGGLLPAAALMLFIHVAGKIRDRFR